MSLRFSASQWLSVLALAFCYCAAIASVTVMPIAAGALVAGLRIPTGDVGYVFALELTASAAGSIAISPWVARIDAGRALPVALVGLILVTLASYLSTHAGAYIGWRCLVGVIEGGIQGLVLALAARTRAPQRAFGAIFTLAPLVESLLFVLLPHLEARWGIKTILLVPAAVAAVALGMTPFIVARGVGLTAVRPLSSRATPVARNGQFILVLVSWFLFIVAQAGVWVYLAQIAAALHIAFAAINLILAGGSFCGIFAGMVAGWCDRRFAFAGPLALIVLANAAALGYYGVASDTFDFGVSTLLGFVALYFAFPFFSSLASEVDPTGRIPALLPAAQASGLAIGPAVASLVLGGGENYPRVCAVGFALALLGLLVVIPALKAGQQMKRAPAAV